MEDVIKRRKRLSPVRVELSRELDEEIVDKLCRYMDIERKYFFRNLSPLDLSSVFAGLTLKLCKYLYSTIEKR